MKDESLASAPSFACLYNLWPFNFSSVQFSSVTEFMFYAIFYGKNYDGCTDA